MYRGTKLGTNIVIKITFTLFYNLIPVLKALETYGKKVANQEIRDSKDLSNCRFYLSFAI